MSVPSQGLNDNGLAICDAGHGPGRDTRDADRVPRVLMSVAEAARVLAISRSYAYELVASGFLSSIRLGRRVLVPLSAVDDLLARGQDDF